MVCECCATCDEEYATYTYHQTIPPAPGFCDCPCYNASCIEPNAIGPTGLCNENVECVDASCCGDELNCYVRSRDFPIRCTNPRATVFQGSTLDDHGTISGQTETITTTDRCLEPPYSEVWGVLPPTGGLVTATQTLVPFVVNNGDGTQYLKLNVVAKNGIPCGPYGVQSLSVRWWFDA